MKKQSFKVFLIIPLLLLFALFICCGENTEVGDGTSDNDVIIDTTRKVYYTCNISITSKKANEIYQGIYEKAKVLEGYAGYSDISYNQNKNITGKVIFKIPTEHLNEFLNFIDSTEGVVNKQIQATDITSKYNETLARIETLEASKKAYLASLENTTNYSDKILIISRIEEIDTELARINKEKESMDNLLDFSTVTITFNLGSKKANQSFFEEYFDYLGNFFVGLFKVIMYLLPFALIAGVILLIIFFSTRKSKKNKMNSPKN